MTSRDGEHTGESTHLTYVRLKGFISDVAMRVCIPLLRRRGGRGMEVGTLFYSTLFVLLWIAIF